MPLVSASSEVRRNLIGNPVGGTPVTGWSLQARWFGSGAAGTITPLVAGPVTLPDGTVAPSFFRKTWTMSGGSTSDVGFSLYNAQRVSVTAGTAYTIQLHWRRSWGGALDVCSWRLMFFNAVSGGAQVGSTVMGPTITPPAVNTWQQDSITFTPPAGTTHFEPVFYIRALDGRIPVGGTLDATAACAEAWPALRRPFWGDYSPDLALFSRWLGPVNASASGLMTPEIHAGTAAVALSVTPATTLSKAAGTSAGFALTLAGSLVASKQAVAEAVMLLDTALTAAAEKTAQAETTSAVVLDTLAVASKQAVTDAGFELALAMATSTSVFTYRDLTIKITVDPMTIERQERRWYTGNVTVNDALGNTVTIAPDKWEISLDTGRTWVRARPHPQISTNPAWLVAGPDFPGTNDPSQPIPGQVMVSGSTMVLWRLVDFPEVNLIRAGAISVKKRSLL